MQQQKQQKTSELTLESNLSAILTAKPKQKQCKYIEFTVLTNCGCDDKKAIAKFCGDDDVFLEDGRVYTQDEIRELGDKIDALGDNVKIRGYHNNYGDFKAAHLKQDT